MPEEHDYCVEASYVEAEQIGLWGETRNLHHRHCSQDGLILAFPAPDLQQIKMLRWKRQEYRVGDHMYLPRVDGAAERKKCS